MQNDVENQNESLIFVIHLFMKIFFFYFLQISSELRIFLNGQKVSEWNL